MKHTHQFILIEQTNRRPKQEQSIDFQGGTATNTPIGAVWQDQYGARVGCPICGDIRTIWANGDIIIEHEGNTRE